MRRAIEHARQSKSEVPVGAILLSPEGEAIASAVNNREASQDPTGHAEILALRAGGQIMGDWRLEDCTLVVTLEPCVMCSGAILEARISKVIFGAYDLPKGAAGSAYDVLRDPRLGVGPEVIGGVLETECAELLSNFFGEQRP
jgi:tRNA(adenine34) deaminase